MIDCVLIKWFVLFVFVICPLLCIVSFYILSFINDKKEKTRSVAQWREDNLKAQEEMRKQSGWYEEEK